MMERLYSKEDIIFDGFNSKREIPYRIKNNVWDFKTRKVLQQLSISDLINAITNMLETIEMIGIKNNVYKMKN